MHCLQASTPAHVAAEMADVMYFALVKVRGRLPGQMDYVSFTDVFNLWACRWPKVEFAWPMLLGHLTDGQERFACDTAKHKRVNFHEGWHGDRELKVVGLFVSNLRELGCLSLQSSADAHCCPLSQVKRRPGHAKAKYLKQVSQQQVRRLLM